MAGERRGERGSVLILIPAGVLVVMILGALCVDLSIAYLAQHQLHDAASAAVNDAAGAALSEARLRQGDGQVTLDPDRAVEVARQSIEASLHAPVRLTSPPVVEVVGTHITVRLEGEAPYVFSPSLPGVPKRAKVRAVAGAELRPE